jgi:hypothetical protein
VLNSEKESKVNAINHVPTPRQWEQARRRVKAIIDGPNIDIDRMIRAVLANGQLTNELRETFSVLTRRQLAQQVEAAVRSSLRSARLAGPVQP